MAQCNFCSAANKKLFKALYMNYRVYVCKYCIVYQNIEVEKEKASA